MGAKRSSIRTLIANSRLTTVRQDQQLTEAARAMRDARIGSLLVVDDTGQVVGIVTERDIVSRALANSRSIGEIPVSEVMTTNIVWCDSDTPIAHANDLMVSRHIRHLPVVEEGKPLGMVSSRDVLAHQLRVTKAMTAAAEQTAKLIKPLRSLELEETLNVLSHEVPRIFDASRWVLHLRNRHTDGEAPPVVRKNQCPCPRKVLLELAHSERRSEGGEMEFFAGVPLACRRLGCNGPHVFLPLCPTDADESAHTDAIPEHQCFLCMCGLPWEATAEEEVVEYKGKLLQEILNAALANAQRYQESVRRSHTDELTGVHTRRVFEEKLQQEHARGLRYGRPFCVAIFDVDRFKAVNDEHGHAAGDQLLRDLAAVLKGSVRATDSISRYGGDEFVIVLPETALDQSEALLNRIREAVEQTLRTPTGQAVAVSGGLAQWDPDSAELADQLFRRADANLYEAKRAGRNRVVARSVAEAMP